MYVFLLSAVTKVSFPGLGIHNLPIDRVAFSIGSFDIYWYSICLIIAFFSCVGLAMLQAKKYDLTPDHVIDYALVCIPSALVGARLYYVAFEWSSYKSDLKSILDIRSGGLAVLGGVLGALIAAFILTKIKKLSFVHVLGALIVYIPLGQAIGRWGNFFNQEAFGTTTNLPWGMISSETTSYLNAYYPLLDSASPVHPTFLYESLACLLIFVLLLLIRDKVKNSYATIAGYFILYGIARFFIEGLRTDSLYIGSTSLRSSQVLSAVLVVAGFLILAYARYRDNSPSLNKAMAEDADSQAGDELGEDSTSLDDLGYEPEKDPADTDDEKTSETADAEITDSTIAEENESK